MPLTIPGSVFGIKIALAFPRSDIEVSAGRLLPTFAGLHQVQDHQSVCDTTRYPEVSLRKVCGQESAYLAYSTVTDLTKQFTVHMHDYGCLHACVPLAYFPHACCH